MGTSVAVWMILATLLCIAEWIDPANLTAPVRPRRGDLVRDACWAGVYLTCSPYLGLLLASETSWISRHIRPREVGGVAVGVQFVVGVALADLVAYWLHRLAHRLPALWRLHRLHHSSSTLRWWSSFRFHPLESTLSHAVPVGVVTLAGIPSSVSACYLGAVFAVTLFAHADVFVPVSPLGHAVVLPDFHRRHHDDASMSTNFAVVLPLWDVMFRTAYRHSATPTISDVVLTTALDATATSQRT